MEEFENSIDATEYLDNLQKMLYDPRLVNWCKATDQNFMANSYASLQQMQVKLTELKNRLDEAC